LTSVNNLPATFYIRITLSDAVGKVVSNQVKITKEDCLNGNTNDRNVVEPEIKIFPNPNDGAFWISGIHESTVTLSVKDITGRIVQTKKVGKINNVPIFVETQNLPIGIYLISLEGEQTRINVKIVKQ
jgi:Secretion system C-terminal sorting domain